MKRWVGGGGGGMKRHEVQGLQRQWMVREGELGSELERNDFGE